MVSLFDSIWSYDGTKSKAPVIITDCIIISRACATPPTPPPKPPVIYRNCPGPQ